jgi:hypothetical protein
VEAAPSAALNWPLSVTRTSRANSGQSAVRSLSLAAGATHASVVSSKRDPTTVFVSAADKPTAALVPASFSVLSPVLLVGATHAQRTPPKLPGKVPRTRTRVPPATGPPCGATSSAAKL